MRHTEDASIRRPRMTPDREPDLLITAMDALREVGYQDLSMDLVAARARCSKATLYRLWPGKPQLVAAALYATRPAKSDEINTGTLRGDLLCVVGLLAAQPLFGGRRARRRLPQPMCRPCAFARAAAET
jgi:AcrR family transcriptional regulator